MNKALWIAVKSMVAAVLVAASYFALRMGVADTAARRETVEGLGLAVRLEPGNADFHRWLAIALLPQDPARSEREFREAFRLNRFDAQSRMRLAALLETQGRLEEAEQGLLETTKYDRTFQPRWSLANFYFRRERLEEFWKWIRSSVEMSYGDRTPIFELAAATGETKLAERLGIEKDEVWLGYLYWGLGKAPASEVKTAALGVARAKQPNGPALAAACGRLMDLGDIGGALEVWNAGAEAGVVAAGAAARGAITNGEFKAVPGGSGFDWVADKPQGVTVLRETEQGGLRIRMNGNQPENCRLLAQRVAVDRGAAYKVQVKYRTFGLKEKSGLRWGVWSAKGLVGKPAEYLWAVDGGEAEFGFRAPADADWVWLALAYERPAGQVRAEGEVGIESVAMER